ncbi:hypothetical protein PAEPH01_1565 [Pancytospora epiphaga]|nr:hypothetical protein PAEPH01_1565 [Pancytospora epiphaga]
MKKSKTIKIAVISIAVLSMIVVALCFGLKENEPSQENVLKKNDFTPTSISTGGLCFSKPNKKQEVEKKSVNNSEIGLFEVRKCSLGNALKKHIEDTYESGVNEKNWFSIYLLEMLPRSCYIPNTLAESGYVALFLALLPYLNDPSNCIHKIFFNLEGYDEIINATGKSLNDIEALFERVRVGIKSEKDVYAYLEQNIRDVILAFKYVMIKKIWSSDDAIYDFVSKRADIFNMISGFICNIKDIKDVNWVFRKEYVYHAIENLEQNDNIFGLTDIEMEIFGNIFKINIYYIILKLDDNIKTTKRLGDLENNYAINYNSFIQLIDNNSSKHEAACKNDREQCIGIGIVLFVIEDYFIPILEEYKTK